MPVGMLSGKQNVDLYMTFVDLAKTFDTVSRDGLWKIMAACVHSYGYVKMVENTLNYFR